MEKMPLKWVMGHQLSFVMALMFVLLDLTNEVSSGTVSQASELMEKLLTLCNSPLPEEKTVCISVNYIFLEKKKAGLNVMQSCSLHRMHFSLCWGD